MAVNWSIDNKDQPPQEYAVGQVPIMIKVLYYSFYRAIHGAWHLGEVVEENVSHQSPLNFTSTRPILCVKNILYLKKSMFHNFMLQDILQSQVL